MYTIRTYLNHLHKLSLRSSYNNPCQSLLLWENVRHVITLGAICRCQHEMINSYSYCSINLVVFDHKNEIQAWMSYIYHTPPKRHPENFGSLQEFWFLEGIPLLTLEPLPVCIIAKNLPEYYWYINNNNNSNKRKDHGK